MRIWPIIWDALRAILVPIAGWLLGGRLSIGYVYLVNGITNPEIVRADVLITLFVAVLILVNLHPKCRPTRGQAIRLLLYGLILAGVSAFITLEVYALLMGERKEGCQAPLRR